MMGGVDDEIVPSRSFYLLPSAAAFGPRGICQLCLDLPLASVDYMAHGLHLLW
ncbi:hypothetical protein BRADI_1g19906v3 [Brachypodium distachyon]|uniref:Uncharacterized protein n=1 Tax=Brachypodium distachyon TaxID=15368 RepID=A0A2K2DK61_BRADI|nr:hypothetical protein BRADI_1g19906v3 [Brachypodium distachyon]